VPQKGIGDGIAKELAFGDASVGCQLCFGQTRRCSIGHNAVGVDLRDPNLIDRPYDKWVAYGQWKSASALFAVGLDKRGKAHNVRFAVHPGGVLTDLIRYTSDEELKMLICLYVRGAAPGAPYFSCFTFGSVSSCVFSAPVRRNGYLSQTLRFGLVLVGSELTTTAFEGEMMYMICFEPLRTTRPLAATVYVSGSAIPPVKTPALF
jgi:NAD(P)-dependent dehydrogenase (short-subunit alcohol dehydrogenase family)